MSVPLCHQMELIGTKIIKVSERFLNNSPSSIGQTNVYSHPKLTPLVEMFKGIFFNEWVKFIWLHYTFHSIDFHLSHANVRDCKRKNFKKCHILLCSKVQFWCNSNHVEMGSHWRTNTSYLN